MRDKLDIARSHPPLVRRAAAGLVLVAAAALAVWVVIGLIKTILWIAVAVLVVAIVGWALKTLVW